MSCLFYVATTMLPEYRLNTHPNTFTHTHSLCVGVSGEWSSNYKDFVRTCLVKNPEERPTAAELLDHPFIQSAGPSERLFELVGEHMKISHVSGAPSASTLKKFFLLVFIRLSRDSIISVGEPMKPRPRLLPHLIGTFKREHKKKRTRPTNRE